MTAQQPELVNPKFNVVSQKNDETQAALERYEEIRQQARDLNLDHKKEDTRSEISKIVLATFCILIGLFTAAVCLISIFGDVSKLSQMSEMVQLILSAISPVVTFVLGYYFATRESQ